MDAVQAADSGHPGTPMALAPLAYVLYTRHMRHDPAAPNWMDRDRCVLSAGHASMLQYASLFLAGYPLTLEDIKQFRQWGSKTPGHPEHGHTVGIETTTGPLGQGLANAVGLAVAESHLAARFNREGHDVINHHTYFIAGDGCLMEGISHEAASFAGKYKLGKLIGFFDSNNITIDAKAEVSSSDDAGARFLAYGWHVLHVSDVNDLDALDEAINSARTVIDRPSLIILTTRIGYGSPNRENTSKAHGEALGADEILLTKAAYEFPSTEPFFVPEEAVSDWRTAVAARADTHAEWNARWSAYAKAHPDLATELERQLSGKLRDGWEALLPTFDAKSGNVATRAASGVVLNAIAPQLPELIGGSADLAGSNLTTIKSEGFYTSANPELRNFHFGVREHAMGAMMNGMALHGGIIPYGGTFLVFSDYMRPAIRLAALMKQQVIYVFTHDSIGLGEDGPTHQPIEQLSALRCIPGLTVMRPGDADEVAECWRLAVLHRDGPVAIALTRQKLSYQNAPEKIKAGVQRGAYVLLEAEGGDADVVLLASGSELEIAVAARLLLAAQGIKARVVSCPSLELFAKQDVAYRGSVLLTGVARVAIEAAHPMSWYQWVGDFGAVIGLDHFGASAPYQTLYKEFGITAEHMAEAAKRVLSA
ncbi:MAG: transketolase [Gemmatimonadota bacterium]|nr:transketolase [Gemmatimonadota bacterium]